MDPDFFAPPPFKALDALQRVKRDLRELGLQERDGRFEKRGQAIAKVADDTLVTLKLSIVKQPSRSPEWVHYSAANSADVRRFIDHVKQQLARWSTEE